MFYSKTLLRTIAWEDSLSDRSDKLFQRDKREARIYRSSTGKNVVEHQKITDNHTHKKASSQGMILLLFYVWEGARVWLVEISLMHIFTI